MEKVVEGGSCLHCAFRELLIYCGLPGALQLKIRFFQNGCCVRSFEDDNDSSMHSFNRESRLVTVTSFRVQSCQEMLVNSLIKLCFALFLIKDQKHRSMLRALFNILSIWKKFQGNFLTRIRGV